MGEPALGAGVVATGADALASCDQGRFLQLLAEAQASAPDLQQQAIGAVERGRAWHGGKNPPGQPTHECADAAHVATSAAVSFRNCCRNSCGTSDDLVAPNDATSSSAFARWPFVTINRTRSIIWASVIILVSYWVLLYFVPVPGFSAPGFDAVGNWPAYVDRAVIGTQHFFQHYKVDGQVVFDPEGILSTWPACFSVLLGVLVGLFYASPGASRPAVTAAITATIAGAVLMLLAYLIVPVCPIIKNLWTGSFALFSGGFALVLLGLLAPVTQAPGVRPLFWPARIFGENPLLAYIIVFLMAPLVDAEWFGTDAAPLTLRSGGQAWFEQWMSPNWASLTFGLGGLLLLFVILLLCHRQRWILKL